MLFLKIGMQRELKTLWMEYMHSALCVLTCNKILEEDPFYAFHSPAAEQAAGCVIPSPSR